MNQKSRRITITVLAIALALVLTAGLCTFFVKRTHHAGEAVLSEEDFEYGYASSLAYGADTQETSEGAYGWGYQPSKEAAEYAYITKIDHTKLQDLLNEGVTKLVLNIPTEHNGVPVKFIRQDAFADCTMTIVDIHMPLSVYWEINKSNRFTFNNQFAFARADGETATFTAFTPQSGTGEDKQPITTLVLPSNVWINENGDKVMDDDEPRYRYTEYLFEGESSAVYTNLVVMPDVVNIFNGKGDDSPKMQGGLLSKSKNLKSVYFCTGRSEILHLYPLTFENCTSLTEISLSAGVYLEDGARVFQGSSALEKFTIAEEKSASAPLFYTVGADGALYTNDYAYTHFSQSNMEKYYEWWKKGNPASGYESEISPSKAYDSELQIEEKRLEEDNSETKTHNDFLGDSSSSSAPATYYAKGSGGSYDSGIGIPEGSYVFDFNDGSSTADDFEKGSEVGNYQTGANFQSRSVDGTFNSSLTVDFNNIKLTASDSGATVDKTARYFRSEGGKTYTFATQIKKARSITVEVPFQFTLTAYFVRKTDDTSTSTTLGLYKGWDTKKQSGTLVGSKLTNAPRANAGNVSNSDFTDLSTGLLESENLSANTKYTIAEDGSTGLFRLFALVITPSEKQTADRLVIEQALQTDPGEENWGTLTEDDWEVVQNDSLLLSVSRNGGRIVDRRHPSFSIEGNLLFRMRLLTAAGEPIRSQTITGSIKKVDGEKMYGSYVTFQTVRGINEDGYYTFTISLDSSAHNWEALSRKPKVAVIEFTTDGITKKLYFNFTAAAGMAQSKIPNPDKFVSGAAETTPMYLPLVDERAGRYQTLVSMPAKAKNADTSESEYVNFFDFDYRETVEIGPNAFQNTYITVIDIPDRIAKIGASAFRFSERLQTVYLPDKTEIALNAFGQEADADTVNKTVFTAGKKNFFLIAPSRASYEMYMEASADNGDSNYNTFPIHVEAEVQGFDKRAADGRGKDASYDYTPYLTYEISVNFLTYDGDTITGTETRSFLYGMDVRYVKATATTEWAVYDDLYDNNAPVYFGYISDGKVQQINTLPTDIPWSVAANGWYYNESATFPEGTWYFGENEVTDPTDFFGGKVPDTAVNGFSFENRAQIHYAEVYSATSDMKGVTQTGKDAGDLRHAITKKSIEKGEDDPKWVWDEEAHEGLGAVYETHSTMPFSVTLRSKSQAPDTKIALEVPDFQRIGEVTLDNEVTNILTKGSEVMDSWKMPKLTVTFDFNGFAPSRIFEGFNSSAMKVTYLTEYSYNTGIKDERGYDIWGNGWASTDPKTPDQSYASCEFEKWSYKGVPYDTGRTFLIELTLNEALGDYQYVWGGDYNGVHVNANDTSAKYFLLYIQTRNVHVSGTPTYVPYTGEEWDIFANNPYYGAGYSIVKSDLVRDESGNPIVGSFGPNGLPCGAGAYTVYLGTYDPKYSGSSDSGYNLAFVGNGIKGTSVEITLYIVDEPIYDSYEYGTYDEPHGDRHTTVFEAPMAQIEDHANSFVYNGAPISLEDVFNQHFVESATEYSITRNGVHVTEIKDVGTYVVTVKPAEGYIWWRGEEVDHYVYLAWDWSGYIHDGWKLDEFWESLDGSGKYDADPDKYDKYYEEFKTATLTFEFTVDPRPISVPQDSFVPVGVDPPYIFAAPIGGDYEVVGYHLHDFETGEIPKASESAQWSSVIIESGVYDVLLRLTDPVNCTWYPDAGEPHGGNYYQTARLYASFDREKAYAVMNDDLGTVTGASGAESWVTLTRTYDGEPLVADLNVGNVLATLFKSAPTAEEVRIAIYKLSAAPVGIGGFVGEEAYAIEDAGYYGVIVTLNDPFVYAGTGATAAYYLVHIEEAEIGRNTGSSFEWEREHLFRADDEGIELKLPDDSTASDYPLTLVSPARNGVTVTYHLETHEEKDHDPDLIEANLASLRAGEDPFEGDWYEYSEEKLRVKNPLGYCVYVKVEAPNHETYYDYISLHIFHEELKITLRTDVGSSVPYGDSVHTQAALRTAVFDAIESITVSGNDGDLGGRENMKDDLTQDYFFFYFMKDGKEYDIEESEETYLDVGTYDLYVRYSGPVLGTAEETTHFIRFSWEGSRPQFTITARELTLDLGAIAGHTYLDMPASPWYEHQIVTYKGAEENAIVTRDGTKDDPQISILFEKDGESYPSLNAISSAGTYTVRAVCGNPNYAVRLAEAYTYTVAPRTLTVEAFPSVPYDGTEHKPTVVFGGLPEHVVLLETDYTLSFVPPAGVALSENGLPLAAGSYQATVTLNSNNYAFAEGSSYTAAFVIEYTSLDLPYLSPTSFPYTGEDLRGDVTAALGNYIPAAMTVSFFTTDDGTGTALERVVDAGTYFVKLTLTDGNYRWRDASEIFLSFTVSRRTQPSLTLTASDAEATYGDSGDALRPAVSGVPQGFDVSYLYTYEGVDGTEYARSDSAPVNVGKYLVTITVVYAGGVNDEPFTATATAHLTILARALTFSLDPAEGAGGLIGAVFKDGSGNAVALAATDYSFAYSFGGTAVESMTKAGEYTVTVTLIGEAAVNNRLVNATAVYTLTQDLSGDVGGGDVGGGDVGGGDEGGEVGDDFDVGAAIVLMGVQVILLAVVFGLAVRKKRTESVNAEEGN